MWAGFSPVVVSAQGLCVGRHSPGSSNRHSALKNDTFMLILNAKILSVDALPTSEYPAGQLRDLAVLLSLTCSTLWALLSSQKNHPTHPKTLSD